MSYIGQQPLNNFVTKQSQTFTPDGSTTGFTLNFSVTSGVDIMLVINNVVQEPGAGKAYTASGTTLTMSEAPGASDSMYCIFLGLALQTVNPGDGSVGTAKLVDSAVTNAKIANSTIDLTTKVTGVLPAANGQTMTPAFVAYKTSNQSISNTTATKITFEAEQIDSGTVYDTSTSRFTPGETGYYWIGARWRYDTGTDFDTAQYRIYKNGSIIAKSTFINQNANGGFLNMIIYTGSVSDYYEMYGYQNSGGSVTINGNSTYVEQDQAQFYAFKIIGI